MNLPKNNESTTVKSDASELGPPTSKDAALANVGTKIVNKSECVKKLGELFAKTACIFAIMHILNGNICMFRHFFAENMVVSGFRSIFLPVTDCCGCTRCWSVFCVPCSATDGFLFY